jgi:hypothetical protein
VEFARKVETVDESELGNVRRLLAGGGHGDPEAQFEFDLDRVIESLALLLKRIEKPGGKS